MKKANKMLIKKIIDHILKIIPFINIIYYSRESQIKIKFSHIFFQKICGINRKVYWPVHFSSCVVNYKNIYCGIETCPGFMPGCYIQGGDKIIIGNYTQIGPNVGIIGANHDIYNNKYNVKRRPIIIGEYCWIGMNAVILPGVHLGDFTIVAAGSVVSKSFPTGYCIIGGNPAEKLYTIDKSKCIEERSQYEYNGYIKHERFELFRKKHLNV